MATPCGEAHEKDALCHAHYQFAQELPLPAKIELMTFNSTSLTFGRVINSSGCVAGQKIESEGYLPCELLPEDDPCLKRSA